MHRQHSRIAMVLLLAGTNRALVMLAGTAGVVTLRGVIPALEPPDPLLIGVVVFA